MGFRVQFCYESVVFHVGGGTLPKSNPFKIQEGSVRDDKVKGFIKEKEMGDHLDLKYLDKPHRVGRFLNDRKYRSQNINIL